MIIASIVIYSALSCPYCTNAKALLDSKHITYNEINVDKDPSKLKEMFEISNGMRTVPQIFIDGKHIGGFSDLKRLSESGELDILLKK